MQEKASGIKPVRILVLLLVIFAVPMLMRLIENIPITVTQLAYYLLNGAILSGFLAWLVPKIRLSLWSLILLVCHSTRWRYWLTRLFTGSSYLVS